MIAHEVQMLPLSILYDSEGKELWSASGLHDINEVKKELELITEQYNLRTMFITVKEKRDRLKTNILNLILFFF